GWLRWVLLPLLWGRSRPGPRAIALSAILWGFQALGGHPPYWVLTGLAAVTVLFVRFIDRSKLGETARAALVRIAAFGLLGVAVGAVQLIPTALISMLSQKAGGLGSPALFEFSATPVDLLGVAFANAFTPARSPAWDLYQSWYPGGFWAFLESYAYVRLPALAF